MRRLMSLLFKRLEKKPHVGEKGVNPRISKFWFLSVKGLRHHISIDDSLKYFLLGRHGACGWSVVQFGHDGEREPEPRYGYFGPIEAGMFQRAQMTVFSGWP